MKNKVTLYIVTHNKTGLKYFGKTIRWFSVEDLQKNYLGSGKRWHNHLKIHGKDITFEIYGIFSLIETDDDYVKPIAMKFSEENQIADPKSNWANLMIEDGLSGRGMPGRVVTQETKQKMRESQSNNPSLGMLGKMQSDHQKKRASETHKTRLILKKQRKKYQMQIEKEF